MQCYYGEKKHDVVYTQSYREECRIQLALEAHQAYPAVHTAQSILDINHLNEIILRTQLRRPNENFKEIS
jgi:hypothetical protein